MNNYSALLHILDKIELVSGIINFVTKTKLKLRGLSPRANYTDRAAAAGRRS